MEAIRLDQEPVSKTGRRATSWAFESPRFRSLGMDGWQRGNAAPCYGVGRRQPVRGFDPRPIRRSATFRSGRVDRRTVVTRDHVGSIPTSGAGNGEQVSVVFGTLV